MSEEEIIKYLEKVSKEKTIMPLDNYIKGLLNLYNKEKEKNRDLQIFVDDVKEGVYIDYPEFEEKYISKDKIKEAMKDCVSSYDCLKEKINILLYGEEYLNE